MALTGRKKVAMSKLMVPIIANKGTPLKTWSVYMYLSNPRLSTLTKYRYTGHRYTMPYVYPFAQRFFLNVKSLRPVFDSYIKTDHMPKNVPSLAIRGYH